MEREFRYPDDAVDGVHVEDGGTSDRMTPRRIEDVSLNSWPALRQCSFDGWVLRFSKGYTKRANSINPVGGSTLDIRNKVDVCETLYAERGLPTVFRLTSFSSLSDLDDLLAVRGYQKVDPTLVLSLDLRSRSPTIAILGEMRELSLNDWLIAFCGFKGSPVADHQTHCDILEIIPSTRFLAMLSDDEDNVACGMAVLEAEYVGLFDIVTDPQRRRSGYGTALVAGLLNWARNEGAAFAYLQVVSENEPARRLYAKLGFQEAYRYWYRVSG